MKPTGLCLIIISFWNFYEAGVMEKMAKLSLHAACVHNFCRDHIWVHVGSRAAVFEVSESFCLCGARDSNRAATICDSVGKFFNGCSFVKAS